MEKIIGGILFITALATIYLSFLDPTRVYVG